MIFAITCSWHFVRQVMWAIAGNAEGHHYSIPWQGPALGNGGLFRFSLIGNFVPCRWNVKKMVGLVSLQSSTV